MNLVRTINESSVPVFYIEDITVGSTNRIAIHPDSLSAAVHFLSEMHNLGYTWTSKVPIMKVHSRIPNTDVLYRAHGKVTVYYVFATKTISYSTLEFAIEKNYKVIEINKRTVIRYKEDYNFESCGLY